MEKKCGSRGEEGVKVVEVPQTERVLVCPECDSQEWIIITDIPGINKKISGLYLGNIDILECTECGHRHRGRGG